MEARDFGYLACRFLSVLCFTWGLAQAQAGLLAIETTSQMSGAFGDLMRRQQGYVWVLILTAVLYFSSACFLWYKAEWLSTLFVRNPSHPVPKMSRNTVVSTGLGLIGVLVILREFPDALQKAAYLLDDRRSTTTHFVDIVAVTVPILMTVVGLLLVTKNLQWSEIFNYSFKADSGVADDAAKDEWR
ncbi:MAG: hypothetical protein HONBIEJF_00391 [Fimbriimonadaceae bacterium]|nr:hypothetical protein [Fimbriimonadaceae bacterium]